MLKWPFPLHAQKYYLFVYRALLKSSGPVSIDQYTTTPPQKGDFCHLSTRHRWSKTWGSMPLAWWVQECHLQPLHHAFMLVIPPSAASEQALQRLGALRSGSLHEGPASPWSAQTSCKDWWDCRTAQQAGFSPDREKPPAVNSDRWPHMDCCIKIWKTGCYWSLKWFCVYIHSLLCLYIVD